MSGFVTIALLRLNVSVGHVAKVVKTFGYYQAIRNS